MNTEQDTGVLAQITPQLDDDLLDHLDTEADEYGVSRSEHLRDILVSHREYGGIRAESAPDVDPEAVAELHERVDDLERENDRLHRERRQLLEQREEHTELVRYPEAERSIQQRCEANVLRCAWWWVAGESGKDATT